MARNEVHFLDTGSEKYGDCILLRLGDRDILIDGGNPSSFASSSHMHDSVPDQLKRLLGPVVPHHVDLLVVTHAHKDHIGCLPKLVSKGLLTADWALVADPDLGWGNPVDDSPIDAGFPPAARAMWAALREEPLGDATDAEIEQLLFDAEVLRPGYLEMLATLEASGTKVRRYRGTAEISELEAEFADVGMMILGPTRNCLLLCADEIERLGGDFLDASADLLAKDSGESEVARYRRLIGSQDFMDASRPGAALNDMSLALSFEFEGVRILTTGDAQLVDSGVPGDLVQAEMDALRELIRDSGPYHLAKIGHHGSHNAFDAQTLAELGDTPNLVICTGRNSTKHPDRDVLDLLSSKSDVLQWVRTDRNGLCSFYFEDDSATFEIQRGTVSDDRVNRSDASTTPARTHVAEPSLELPPAKPVTPSSSEPPATSSPPPDSDVVEVVTRVPHRRTRVTVTIDVDPAPDDADASQKRTTAGPTPKSSGPEPKPAERPSLLFVSERHKLAANVGEPLVAELLTKIASDGHKYVDVGGTDSDVPTTAAARVREISKQGGVKGVVILGGFDVVPGFAFDVLPPTERQALGESTEDPDDFVVWSDDLYGCLDGDNVAELPVSRIPDGRSADLLKRAMASRPPAPAKSRQGVRNVMRPFADAVFDRLPGSEEMLVSRPAHHRQVPSLSQDLIYLMLHGHFADATEFHGEGVAGGHAAVRIENIPGVVGSVVFTGCCWGALSVDKPAIHARSQSSPMHVRTPADSIALKFLAAGANAFVGCTGIHYSPTSGDYEFFGGPMHHAFFRHVTSGKAPAEALFAAKMDYLAGMFHGRTDVLERAVEWKILRQFTCLGLGW